VNFKKTLRAGFFFSFLLLIFGVQPFWFANAWRHISVISQPSFKFALEMVWFAALFIVIGTSLRPIFGRLLPARGLGNWAAALTRVWLLASFCAFVAYQAVNLIGWIWGAAVPQVEASLHPAQPIAFHYAAFLAGCLPFVAATYGVAAGRLNYQIEKVTVPIAGLPSTLDGLRIAQLSDLHIGEFMPREEIARVVEMANHLKPDLAVITGDFINGEEDPLEDCIRELSRLRAPLGTWGCNGNHEIYAGAEEQAERLFEHYGMKLLRQENVELGWRGGKFNLIGVDYQRDRMTRGPYGRPLESIENLVRNDVPNVLLSHNPNSFPRAAELGIELSLAGHTHGGQVKVEIVDHEITPARLITDFVAGLYELPMKNGTGAARKAFLYVNRGLGTFGFPVRLGVPPEITLLTLRSA